MPKFGKLSLADRMWNKNMLQLENQKHLKICLPTSLENCLFPAIDVFEFMLYSAMHHVYRLQSAAQPRYKQTTQLKSKKHKGEDVRKVNQPRRVILVDTNVFIYFVYDLVYVYIYICHMLLTYILQ